jgi:hypothetical protein
VYSIEDVYDMIEVLVVDAHNNKMMAARAAKENR